jgi:CO/xanthine dehydrogenase Mo-binding subunit
LFPFQRHHAALSPRQAQAQEAARRVKVDYQPLPAVLTIEEAIAANTFFVRDRVLARVR